MRREADLFHRGIDIGVSARDNYWNIVNEIFWRFLMQNSPLTWNSKRSLELEQKDAQGNLQPIDSVSRILKSFEGHWKWSELQNQLTIVMKL
jgi:hypothetical protein